MKILILILAILITDKTSANCMLQETLLPISCADTQALLEKLPSINEHINFSSTVQKIDNAAGFTKSGNVKFIDVMFKFDPFIKHKDYSSYVSATCSIRNMNKKEWKCDSRVYNEYNISKLQAHIRFTTSIDNETANKLIEIIDGSNEIWLSECAVNYRYREKDVINLVSQNGNYGRLDGLYYYSVNFCSDFGGMNILTITEDKENNEFRIKGVGRIAI